MNRFILIRVSVLPNRDFFLSKLSGLIDGTREKKGVANATPFSFGKPYMAIHILCSQKTFCYDCKIQILIFELLTKNSAGASIACGYSHEKKENEQKMVFCSIVIYRYFDFSCIFCSLFFVLSDFFVCLIFYISKC